MKGVYPVLLKAVDDGYYVYVPAWDIHTQGKDLADAIYMARDAIGITGIDYEDDGLDFPEMEENVPDDGFDIKTLVDVDFAKYRRQLKSVSVKKNCTIPAWLNDQAEERGVNFSKVLQDGLMEILEV